MSRPVLWLLCTFAAVGSTLGTTAFASNLALGRPVTVAGGDGSAASVAADGRLAPEGAYPGEAPAVALEGVRSALVVDLGATQTLAALLLQADTADVYFVEASMDGEAWDVLWRLAPQAGVGGLRTRTTVLPQPVPARWLRVRPTTGRAPALSEVQAFAAVPASWPALDVSQPGARLPLWPGLGGGRLAVAGLALASLLMMVAGWSLLARRVPSSVREGRVRQGALVAVAAASLVAWTNFLNFHYTGFVHTWEVFHYYMGAKYLPELGYRRLYACAAAVDAQDGVDLRGHVMRDLRDNRVVPAEAELARAGECQARFSPRRWDDFTRDARFFREVMGNGWFAVRNDHGFNATPAWAGLGGVLARLGPASWPLIGSLALLDVVLVAAMLLVIGRTFGLEAACLAAGYWGLDTLAHFAWTGGGFLRYDWLFWMVLGIAALRRERPAVAGFALTVAALLRVFPAAALVGLGAKVVAEAVAQRSLAPVKRRVRLASGGVAAGVLVLAASTLVTGHGSIWAEFVENSAKHAATPSSNLVGLRVFLAHDADGRLETMTDPLTTDRHTAWRARLTAARRAWRPVQWLALVGFLVLLARAARGLPEWASAVLGTGLMPIAFELSSYYYSAFVVYAVFWPLAPGVGLALASLAWLSQVAMGLWSFPDDQHAWLSLAVVLFVLGVTGALARARSGPRRP